METPLVPAEAAAAALAGQDMSRDGGAAKPQRLAASAQEMSRGASAGMNLFVTSAKGTTHPVRVRGDEGGVPAAVEAQTGCAGFLHFGGKPVSASATPHELGLQHGSTLTAQPHAALCGGTGFGLSEALNGAQASILGDCADCCKENCCCCCPDSIMGG